MPVPVSDEIAGALGAFFHGGTGPSHAAISGVILRSGYSDGDGYVAGRAENPNKEQRVRSSLVTGAPGTAGACSVSSSTTKSTSFDIADRVTDSGYGYDYFGRTRGVPAADTDQPTGGGLAVRYFANDMVASMSQQFPAPRRTSHQDVWARPSKAHLHHE